MKKGKILAVILTLLIAVSLCACGGGSSSGGSGTSSGGGQSTIDYTPKNGGDMIIGVLDHIIETGSGKTVKDYIETVIAPNFPNVTFIYSENSNTVEQEKTAVENLIQQKVDGIICTDAADFEGLIDTCSANEVFVVSCFHQPPAGDIEATKEDLGDDFQYWLGFVGASTEDEYEAGAAAAQKALDEVPDGTIATFGQPGYVEDSFEYQCLQGAWDTLDEAGRYDEKNFFEVKWDDSVVMTLASNVMTINPSAVVATIAAPDLICGKVQTDKAEDTTQVYGVGFVCNTYKTFMEKGSLDYIMCQYGDQTAGAFAIIYNWLNNGVRWSSSKGDYAWIEIPYIEVADAQTMEEWMEYSLTADNSPYTYEDLQTMLVEFNPDASLETANALMTASSLEDVKARRGK